VVIWFVDRRHIGTRLIGSQGISVTTVIGFIAAADTSRFERAEDRERVGVYRRVLAGLNSSSGVIIVIIQAIRRKKGGGLIYRLY
jgi:hypothetical protein